MRLKLFSYFGVFKLKSFFSELMGFGKDILWWVSSRSKKEKVIALIGVLIIVIKIFSVNSSPNIVLPLLFNLILQIVILSYVLYISSMYWFVKAYQFKMGYILSNTQLLHDLVKSLKDANYFKITPTQLIAGGKTNSNELNVIAAIYLPQKAQVKTMHRYVLYLILFSLFELVLNPYAIFLLALILLITNISMTFFDKNAVPLINDSLRITAHALYNYHAYDPKKCKKYIKGSKDPILKQLENLYQEVISKT